MKSLALRALSIGTALSVGAALVAQAPTRTPDQPPRRAEQGAPHEGREGRRGPGGGPLFRDITLTEQQQTRVREIQQRYGQERRQLAEQARGSRPARPQGRDAQRPDSAERAKFRAEREAMRGRMQQLTERQVADLRAVLTGQQVATFDRNVGAMKQRMAERGAKGERGGRRGPARVFDRGFDRGAHRGA
ncbi:Spy/CpxP family protein refolding chaperone [Roseisolibacter sp. H3M3-2]|uniref:Spy/CpxP family protein refolding chaperone n=1 Tax=Roseisolibacter sp. H3M3-2 TaxID=3031323 RepID=UPI0023DC9031|nr:Spy/CpxP family protein refolding chaperone [Roseisolibacter sp. H3M3-2]MDF1503933.1 Spy/CpxP family protein refolding chaperone [Roseisolibacter sp. H3M3-2]